MRFCTVATCCILDIVLNAGLVAQAQSNVRIPPIVSVMSSSEEDSVELSAFICILPPLYIYGQPSNGTAQVLTSRTVRLATNPFEDCMHSLQILFVAFAAANLLVHGQSTSTSPHDYGQPSGDFSPEWQNCTSQIHVCLTMNPTRLTTRTSTPQIMKSKNHFPT